MGREVVFYRVRRIKGRYYLIKEWYDDTVHKKRSKSLGPCEVIENLLKSINQNRYSIVRCGGARAWSKGADLRPSASSVPKSADDNRFPSHGVIDLHVIIGKTDGEDVLRRFYDWCTGARGSSPRTCRDYVNYLRKPLRPRNKHSVVAYRLLYRFLGLQPPEWLRKPREKPDLRIPSLEDIVETLKAIDRENIRRVYNVMLMSGLRLAHACYLLKNIDRLHRVRLDGYYRIDLGIMRNTKYAYVAYLLYIPSRTSIAPNTVTNYARKKKLRVKPKYVRKFVVTQMHMVGIESDIVRYMVGHGEHKPHDISYYDKLAKADKEYSKYAEWLRETLAKLLIKNN